MRKVFGVALAAAGLLALGVADIAAAQGNDDDFTPLNSRIRRERQFPTGLAPRFDRNQLGRATKALHQDMMGQLSRCLYNRSKSGSLDLLAKTDVGFNDFAQIDLQNDRALRVYGFSDCLKRVASNKNSSISLRFTPGALRQWMLQQAYLDRFPEGADWVVAGNSIAAREFPLSGGDRTVVAVMDFADCVVATSPYDADWFYRTVGGTPAEGEALNGLMPALGPCLPAGQQVEASPATLRVWLGEALWHAALNSRATPPAG